MATTYYVLPNAGRGWDSTQDGTSANPFQGAGGLWKALSLATVAGDKVLVQGDIFSNAPVVYDNSFQMVLTTPDKTATWVVGDSLRNNTGSGNHWTGKLYSINATTMVVFLDTGTNTTVNISEGIENITRSETTTCSVKNAINDYLVQLGMRGVGNTTNYVSLIGCNSSWVEKSGYFKSNCTGGYGLDNYYGGYNYIYGLVSVGANVGIRIYSGRATLDHCYVSNFQGIGFQLSNFTTLIDCIANGTNSNANADNFQSGSSRIIFIRCKSINSKGNGFVDGALCKFLNCLAYNSTKNNFVIVGIETTVIGCIADKTGSGYANIKFTAAQPGVLIMHNRITNAATYGIEGSSTDNIALEDYNVFDSNTSGPRLNINAGPNSQTVSDTNQGYADANYATSRVYQLSDTATGRRLAIDYDWDV